ncbi:septation protein SepH [Trebonia sp.]|uniref:septation protein SepH n=1 Tax=Trebonia sp. TaxID=2767075 RepID=UPI002636B9BC|nr:septation protein SepH [Trebonia sp.]
MQELRFVAVSEDGSYAVLAVPGRSARFTLPIDERLRAVALGQTSRLAQYEIEVESPLRPKEIQARIRAGETAEEIADAAGIPVERVRWFEGPVLAERAYVADQAQSASVRRAGDSASGPRLGDIVPGRLTAAGVDPADGQWDSRKRGDGNWQVSLTFSAGGRLHIAEWVFDPRRRHVMPDDDNAARLSLPDSELPPLPASLPGEATVTPLAPRLGAAAGMGSGSLGGGLNAGPAGGRLRAESHAPSPVLSRPAYRDPVPAPQAIAPQAQAAAPQAQAAAPQAIAPQAQAAARSSSHDSERSRPAPQRPPRYEEPDDLDAVPEPQPVAVAAPAERQEPAAAQAAADAADAAEPVDVDLAGPAEPAADEQAAPSRQGKKTARGRRASVPSWDEIMLGSTRQRD